MLIHWLRAVAVALPLGLAACGAQMPPLNFSVPNVGPSTARLDAEVKSLTVQIGRPDEQVGKVDVAAAETSGLNPAATGLGITTAWRTALQESLDRTAIFSDDAHRKVALDVKILRLSFPSAGLSMTTDAVARYEMIDRSNGSIIFRTDISSSGTTPADYAFVGATRARESLNRSVQNNISLFLQQLQTVDLARPMFPVPTPAANVRPTA